MTVLALDLATNLGLCWGGPDELPQLDSTRLPSTGEYVGRFLNAYRAWFLGKLDEIQPGYVVFEAPILPRQAQLATVRKLTGLANVTEMLCEDAGVECGEVQPSQVKKALTGHGRAEKDAMVRCCRAYGLAPSTYMKDGAEASDEADAFGVWLYTVRVRTPEHLDRWVLPMQAAPLFAGGQA